jgi:predicted DCC family thiol-disulfide oxidoreductase YuxK
VSEGPRAASITEDPVRRLSAAPAYSWRSDPAVPRFDDAAPLIVYDGVCVFCSRSMAFVARHDRGAFRFTAAQSQLGATLFRHFGLDPVDFETILVLDAGRPYGKRDALRVIARRLRLPFRALGIVTWLPRRLADRAYDALASRRYAMFGQTEQCFTPAPEWRARVIDERQGQ